MRVVRNATAEIGRATYDSRKVQPGDLFVAIRGASQDGTTYVPAAVARGAVAVLAADPVAVPDGVGLALAPDPRRTLGEVASLLNGRPSERLRLIGVTGTDGKTTTCQLIAHVLAAAGRKVGWMTTVDVRIDEELIPNPFGHTTPEAPAIQTTLDRMVAGGVEDAVLEVSSHALALDRVQGCSFDASVFTNLAAEHLNFHAT